MKTHYLNLLEKIPEMNKVNATLSLKPFVSFVREKIKENKNIRRPFFIYVLEQIEKVDGWDTEITPENIEKYSDLFELVYFTLSTPVTNEHEYFWALGAPLSPHIFFGTEAFYRLLTHKNGKLKAGLFYDQVVHNRAFEVLKIVYTLALKKLYNFSYPLSSKIKISIVDEKTGLNRYYRISFDTRFININSIGAIPKIDFSHYQFIQSNEAEVISYLLKKLPLTKFTFDGFSIVRVEDITAEYAIESIKDIIVNLSSDEKVFCRVIDALRILLNSSDTYLNLIPILKVNGKLVMNSLDEVDSGFWDICHRHLFTREKYLQVIENFIQDPRLLFIRDVANAKDIKPGIQALLQSIGIKAFAVVPIFFQKLLVGALEIYSMKENDLPVNLLATLSPAIPLLEQLLQTTIHNFHLRIDQVIRDKFTALHPSVLWRFNESAWNYIKLEQSGRDTVMEQVHFPDVHPLYGAVDIRNSTVERNNALRGDMNIQLDLLGHVLHQMKGHREMSLIDEVIFKTDIWRRQISEYIIPEDEFRLYLFLENEVPPLLEMVRKEGNGLEGLINDYLKATHPDGKAHTNRRKLENTLQLINRIIAGELDKMNDAIQQIYPCYFERFRSDGIEYDIYIGQSITPQIKFYPFYLRNLRLAQLTSMVEIARQTHALLPTLSKKLQTTQLIFINTHTIDISFRNDERRFDVEGGYNVRYEMMKKRIDKVHILNSKERLTQPGKIALIYFQQQDIEEYISHIHFLQQKGMLNEDIEYLNLEALQGLNGLKALRVGVKM